MALNSVLECTQRIVRIGSKPISENIFFRGIRRKVGRSLTRCLFAPVLVWQDVGDFLDPNYLQTLKAGGRERERERGRETLALVA